MEQRFIPTLKPPLLGSVLTILTLFISLLTLAQHQYTRDDFQRMQGNPLNPNLQRVRSVKYVIEPGTGRLHLVDSKKYRFHNEYCVSVLGFSGDVVTFNEQNYSQNANRQYLLGNLDFHDSLGWFIDLSVLDHQSTEQLRLVAKKLTQAFPFIHDLGILINSTSLRAHERDLSAFLRIITPSELAGYQSIQIIQTGTGIGQLYVVDSLHPLANVTENNILVVKELQDDLPLVRGIILLEMITPLSHISLLAQNRRVPLVVDRNLQVQALKQDSWYSLRVDQSNYKLTPSRPQVVQTQHRRMQLKLDTTVRQLVPAREMSLLSAGAIGNKALNFGRLAAMDQQLFSVPECGYVIPIAYFREHLSRCGGLEELRKLDFTKDATEQKKILKVLRTKIRQVPVSPALIQELDSIIRASSYRTFRFRSSTNAEDLSGFNGAGLYKSTTVDLSDTAKSIERAIKKIWVSCYSERAFAERLHFGISEREVGMGILIHRGFPDEEVNGVILSKNRYRTNYPGISINAQFGDVPVVDPPDGVRCEETVVFGQNVMSGFNRSIEYIRFSSLRPGLVCTEEEMYLLEKVTKEIKAHFWKRYAARMQYNSATNYVLDLEFKLVGPERKLYVKQVRTL